MGIGYYDRKGRPLTLFQWARLREDNPDGYIFIGRTEVGPFVVSTVWLGLDHNFSETGPPLIFETMIFGRGGSDIEYCERYPTEEAALAGHDQAVAECRTQLATPGS